ncbi:MAG: hypothetical protein IJ325_08475 [Clostridia bacterium]|nr:hypothetical protein [Clostridia bacterium]
MNIKKNLCVIAAAVLAAVSLSACNQDATAPNGYITASGEAAGYHFYVPKDWTVDLSTGATSAYCSPEDPSSVSVMKWELPSSDTTLEDWWNMNMEDIEMVFRDVEIVSEADTTVDGAYAKTYVYNASLGEFNYTIQQTAAIRDYQIYLFTYTSTADNFAAHEEEVAQMLQYFTFD